MDGRWLAASAGRIHFRERSGARDAERQHASGRAALIAGEIFRPRGAKKTILHHTVCAGVSTDTGRPVHATHHLA